MVEVSGGTLLGPQAYFAVAFGLVLSKTTRWFSVADSWIRGLTLYFPPEEEQLARLADPSVVGKLRKRKGMKARANASFKDKYSVTLRSTALQGVLVSNNAMYDLYTFTVYMGLFATVNFLFQQLFSCLQGFGVVQGLAQDSLLSFLLSFCVCIALGTMLYLVLQTKRQTYEYKLSIICIICGVIACFLLLDSYALPSFLQFDIKSAYVDWEKHANLFLEKNLFMKTIRSSTGISEFTIHINETLMNIVLSLFCGFLMGCLLQPSFRLARCHDSLQRQSKTAVTQLLSVLNVVLPLVVVVLWIKPLSHDSIVGQVIFDTTITADIFDRIRLYVLYAYAIIKLLLFRPYLQIYLESAFTHSVMLMNDKKDKQRGEKIKLKVWAVFKFCCVVAVEILAPAFFLFSSVLLLHAKGSADLGLCNQFGSQLTEGEFQVFEPKEGSIILSPAFYSQVVAFVCWWFSLWSSIYSSLFLVVLRSGKNAQNPLQF